MNLIFLAGGSSSRFAPLKEKNLYKFLGKQVPNYQIDKFSEFINFDEAVVVCNENNFEIFNDACSKYKNIKTVVQKGNGMAGAALTGLDEFENQDADVLIANMNDFFEDSLFEAFKSKYSELKTKNHNAAVGVRMDEYFPGGYLVLNDNGEIQEVIEKPGAGNEPSKYVRIVFDYFVNQAELKEAMAKAASESDDVYEVAMTNMMKAGNIFEILKYDGIWKTIKYPWHVLGVMEFFLNNLEGQEISNSAHIAETAVINGSVVIEDDVKIFDGAIINGPAYICKGAILANNSLVRNSIVGEKCIIGFSTEIARSYLGDNVWTHMNYIGDSIIENNVSFGSGTVTANLRLDEQDISVNVKGDNVNANSNKLGAIVASDVRFGVNTSIMPGIKIGANSFVGPNLCISEDIDSESFVNQKVDLQINKNKVDISKINRDKLMEKLKND